MLASTARIVGSANAAIKSAARSRAGASTRRVVGYSTGTNPRSLRSTRIPTSWTAGNTPGPAHDRDNTATLSPTRTLAGTRNDSSCPFMPSSVPAATNSESA